MNLEKDKKVLLFYKESKYDFDMRYPQRTVSGFYSWYLRLIECLRREGYEVHLNDFDLAIQHPNYPIGIVGHPHILENWSLPNPAILGPSMYDHPKLNPNLMRDKRYEYYLVTCEWFRKLFIPFYGTRCVLWYAGVETDVWVDTKGHPKETDFLIYDKIRWNREKDIQALLKPIIEFLTKRGFSYRVLRYGNYSHTRYKELLNKSRAMIFLCEHETQGMAYQEALSSNLPILAWDPGFWSDPQSKLFEADPVPATSVPYFSSECGERFKNTEEFYKVFDKFLERFGIYKPRDYIEENLSLKGSVEIYMRYYSEMFKNYA